MAGSVTMRRRVERIIARRVILDGKAAGYKFNVDAGDGPGLELPEPTDDVRAVLAALFTVDEEHLIFYKDGQRAGWVYLVYGNSGYDVVSDYTTNLEEVMKGASELADKYA